MSEQFRRQRTHPVRGALALLVCTAVGDLAVAFVAAANPAVAAIALGTIATLTTAGIAAAIPMRPSTR